MTDKIDLDALEALEAQARENIDRDYFPPAMSMDDYKFLCALRLAFPALIARAREVERLTAERDALKADKIFFRDKSFTASDRIEELTRERDVARDELAAQSEQIAALKAALEPFAKRAEFLDETADEVTHWHPAVGSPVSAGDLRRALAAIDAALTHQTETQSQ